VLPLVPSAKHTTFGEDGQERGVVNSGADTETDDCLRSWIYWNRLRKSAEAVV